MSPINSSEIESVVNLPGPQRYSYFIKRVSDTEKVWSLKSKDGWVLASDSNDNEIVPVWSHVEYAKLCTNDEWRNCFPEVINLRDWMAKWIPGMIKDKKKIGVFPTIVSKGVIVDPERLQSDLNDELSKIE